MANAAIRYQCQVINVQSDSHLRKRSGPGDTYSIVGRFKNGESMIICERKTLSNGDIWDRIEGTQIWVAHFYKKDNMYYTKTVKDLTASTPPAKPVTNDKPTPDTPNKATNTKSDDTFEGAPDTYLGSSGIQYNIPTEDETVDTTSFDDLAGQEIKGDFPKYVTTNPNGYKVYDYTMRYDDFMENYNIIKKNMNVSSAYTRSEVVDKMFTAFNRFKVNYPQLNMDKCISVVYFTRPDLNIMNGNELADQVVNDPKFYYFKDSHANTLKSLTMDFSARHHLNPFLSNIAGSLEIMDEGIDLLETGETYAGYKIQYGKHNIKSITAGTMSVKFPETYNLHVTKIHQAWVDYIAGVYRGYYMPKLEYVFGKIIDYACDVYYFLLDKDGETIRFWSKYYGVFPLNIPKSVYSYDSGSNVNLPEVTVNYAYFYKDDLSPLTLVEFNENTGGKNNFKYASLYEPKIGTLGRTWVGPPFIESYDNGDGERGFKLRNRPT